MHVMNAHKIYKQRYKRKTNYVSYQWKLCPSESLMENIQQCCILLERFSRAGPRGRGREWATLGIHPRIHPLSWLLSNNRLEKVPFVSVLHTSSNRLLLSNQDKGCTASVAHSLPLPLGPALLNLWTMWYDCATDHTSFYKCTMCILILELFLYVGISIFCQVTGNTVYNMLKLGEVEVDAEDRPVYPPKIKSAEVSPIWWQWELQ